MGHHDGSPKLPDLTQKGEPLAPSFPQATRPMAPFMSISPFIHEALLHHLKDRGSPDGNMAGSHLVSQDPPMLPPCPWYLSLPHPSDPLPSAPVFMHVYCLSLRWSQRPACKRQPEKPGNGWAPPVPPFPLGAGVGE